MAFAMRLAGFWLAACSLGVGVAFVDRELALLPDFYVASWLGHTACLFLVAGAAVSLVVLKSIMRTGAWTIAILIGGHLAAMACTHEFLASRIRCVDIQNGFDYRIPDDTGALILFGPTLVLVLVCVVCLRPPGIAPVRPR